MKKLSDIRLCWTLFLISLILIPVYVQGQAFINDADYAWGEGRGTTLEEADKRALESLVTYLTVNVSVNSILSTSDINGDLNKSYQDGITTKSSLRLNGIDRYIDDSFNGGYRVYRYFNKKSYVEQRKEQVAGYVKLAVDHFYGSQVRGTINLSLGYYYLAFQILNDDLLSLLDGQNEIEKAKILHAIRTIVQNVTIKYRPASLYNYDWSHINNKATRASYDPTYLHISAYYKNACMWWFDFEYWDGVKWSNDYKWNERGDIAEIKCTPLVPRDIKDLKYRINFQIMDGAQKIILPVPDDFYIIKVVEPIDSETISKWVKYDREAGFYN